MRWAPFCLVATCVFVGGAICADPADARQVGVWQFNGNLNNDLPGGAAMSVVGGWSPVYVNEMISGSAATQLSFPAFDDTQALDMPNQAGLNGGSSPVATTNNWSIVMDVKFPAPGNYTSLWETGAIGTSDGDFFVREVDGIGINGEYAGTYTPSDWTRIAVTVDSTVDPGTYTVTGYIDGALAVAVSTSSSPGGDEAVRDFLHLFGDNDFETSDGLVNSVAYYGEVLSESAVGTLGGASAAGIPVAASQKGLWNFNNNLNNAVSGGAPMSVVGGWAPTYVTETIGGSSATVLSFPAMDDTQALDMPNQADRDDSGIVTSTNNWTIVMDVKFPVLTSYTALWETGALGASDGDYFIQSDDGLTGGVGISQQYNGVFQADTWTRLAVTVDGSTSGTGYTVTGYIDGVLAGTATTSVVPNGREAIEAFLHLFADNDFETADGIVNSIAFYDEVLTPEAIAALGGASAAGISVVSVPGDYNEDGVVDAADYTKWRDNLGAAIALPNEGVTPGFVTQEDYVFWKTNYGNSGAGSGTGFGATAVPEPAGCCLAILALMGGAAIRRRK